MYDVRREREDRKRRNHKEKESEEKVEVRRLRIKNTSKLESACSADLVVLLANESMPHLKNL
jgi:hypothetical protein